MKKAFVPISKQTKKAQKAYHSLRRSTWGSLNPATRTMPNGRAYNRKKQKAHDRSGRESSFDSPPLFCPSMPINLQIRIVGKFLIISALIISEKILNLQFDMNFNLSLILLFQTF